MIDRLTPKKIEQKIEGGGAFRVEIVDNSKSDGSVQTSSQAA